MNDVNRIIPHYKLFACKMRGISCIILFFLYSLIFSQSFIASTNQQEIAADQYLEVSFILSNAQGKNFVPPTFKGWTVIQGPSTTSSVSIINGARNSSISYGFVLSPKSIGELIIDKATINVNGKELSTSPLKIRVTKSSPQATLKGNKKELSKKDIFLIGRVIPEKAYVGQQVLVEYKLYTAVDVENYNIIRPPSFDGFHVGNIPRLQQDTRETINGKSYATKVIYTAALYPIQTGKFELDPLHARASVVVESPRNNDPFSIFLLPTTEGVNLISDKISLDVISLPQPSPPNFSGAVGRYAMATSIDQMNVNVNDALGVTIYIEGDGDLNRVGKPFLDLDSTAFQLYEPKITKEDTDFKTSGFLGFRELIYPVIATKPGNHKIIPSFIYFNTDSQKYISLAPEVFAIQVSGQQYVSKENKTTQNKELLKELSIIDHPDLSSGNRFVGSSLFYILVIFPFVAWFTIFLWARKKQKYHQEHDHEYRLTAAKINLIDQLKNKLLQSNVKKEDADLAMNGLQDYLRSKWAIKDLSIPYSEWLRIIQTASISDQSKADLNKIFKEAEFAIYAGQLSSTQIKEMLEKMISVVQSI